MKKQVDIILVGGGSGGHLTPLIPIARALHEKDSSLSIAHLGQKRDPMNAILKDSAEFADYYEVEAGKYRRYFGEKWYVRLLDLKRLLMNLKDVFKVLVGICQSWYLLGKIKPRVILAKGGYVGVPVGLAASIRGIPFVTHDSDAMISLANRILSKKAARHATALDPDEYIGYEQNKTVRVGVPVRDNFNKVTSEIKNEAKKELGYKQNDKILLVLGGGLGARRINEALIKGAEQLLKNITKLRLIHITGTKLLSETEEMYKNAISTQILKRIELLAFSKELHVQSAAADVVITRAGATTLAELSAQGKACIVVPNPLLTGGHQTKNAEILEDFGAVIVVHEADISGSLISQAEALLNSESRQKELSSAFYSTFVPEAEKKIADLLIEVAKDK